MTTATATPIKIGRTHYEVARNSFGYAIVWKIDADGNRTTVYGRKALRVAQAANRLDEER